MLLKIYLFDSALVLSSTSCISDCVNTKKPSTEIKVDRIFDYEFVPNFYKIVVVEYKFIFNETKMSVLK